MNMYLATQRLRITQSTSNQDTIRNSCETLDNLTFDLKNSYNIYYFVGKAGFGDCNNLYLMQPIDIQKSILHKMQNFKLVPQPMNISGFNRRMVQIQFIRNYVMHNDSLEVLCRYTYRNNKVLRKSADRKEYQALIKDLEKEYMINDKSSDYLLTI